MWVLEKVSRVSGCKHPQLALARLDHPSLTVAVFTRWTASIWRYLWQPLDYPMTSSNGRWNQGVLPHVASVTWRLFLVAWDVGGSAPSFFSHPIEDLPFFWGQIFQWWNPKMDLSIHGSHHPIRSHQTGRKPVLKFNSSPLKKWWLENKPFLFGFGHFSGVILNFLNFGRVAFAKPDRFKQFFLRS